MRVDKRYISPFFWNENKKIQNALLKNHLNACVLCITLNLKPYVFDKGFQAGHFLEKSLMFANSWLLQHIDCQDMLWGLICFYIHEVVVKYVTYIFFCRVSPPCRIFAGYYQVEEATQKCDLFCGSVLSRDTKKERRELQYNR